VAQFEFPYIFSLGCVIPSKAVLQAERGISLQANVSRRSLGPLAKTRAVGMTPSRKTKM
jgi:hypothetical protein